MSLVDARRPDANRSFTRNLPNPDAQVPVVIGRVRETATVRRPTRRVLEARLAGNPGEIVQTPIGSTGASRRQSPARDQRAEDPGAKQRDRRRRIRRKRMRSGRLYPA